MLVEIDYCASQCAEYVLGDSDGLYYRNALAALFGLFGELREFVWNVFLDEEKYEYYNGLHITWALLDKSVAVGLQAVLQKVLDENKWQPFISYNQGLDALREDRNIIMFAEEVEEMNPKLEVLYHAGLSYLRLALINQQELIEEVILDTFCYMKLCICPLCSWIEPLEEFDLNASYNVLACGPVCCAKRRSIG